MREMKKEKLKTHVLMLSKKFVGNHPKKGQDTNFIQNIANGFKIHTIRLNCELWKKRIDEVNQGKAVISLRQWIDKPYRSKQEAIKIITKGLVGYEVMNLSKLSTEEELTHIAGNDGLSKEDFIAWFGGMDEVMKDKEVVVIHFTDFRYSDLVLLQEKDSK